MPLLVSSDPSLSDDLKATKKLFTREFKTQFYYSFFIYGPFSANECIKAVERIPVESRRKCFEIINSVVVVELKSHHNKTKEMHTFLLLFLHILQWTFICFFQAMGRT